jgi:hypothetical protein
MKRTVGAALLVVLACAGASAQSSSEAVLRAAGLVRDSLGIPIVDVDVSTLGARTRTDSIGRFTIRVTGGDSTTLMIRRVGYEAVTFTIATDTLVRNDLDIELQALPRALPRVSVTEERRARVPSIESFEERRLRKEGSGYFLSRMDFADRDGQPLTSVLRGVRGVSVVRQGNGRYVLRFARWSGKGTGCAPHVWLDGMLVRDLEVDDITTRDVEAIELYPNSASAPPEFDADSRFACGVVAIWTRRPILKTP